MISAAISRAAHEQRLTTVDHLEELRARLILCLAVLAACFGVCMWQNHALLKLINAPLASQTQKQAREGHGPLGASYRAQIGAREVAVEVASGLSALQRDPNAPAVTRATLAKVDRRLHTEARRLSRPPEGQKPVTLGIGEPFTTTLGVCLLFAFILALPVILYELYAFLIPALTPQQRRGTMPVLMAVPLLFLVGVAFGYLIVLPHAIHFLANFNSSQFNTLVQAGTYYHFAAITLLAMGVIFQVPVGVIALTRAGVVSVTTLRKGRRYAIVCCAAVAALLPGDAITLVLETVPLYLLYEASLLIAGFTELSSARS